MRSTLDLSVIIASYNTRDLLRACLDSVFRNTHDVSFEVICVDDGSPDGSADMVAQLFPQVLLVRNQQRMQYARNHNVGTRLAGGRYACHLDSDTLLTSDSMSEWFASWMNIPKYPPAVRSC
jgi:GT2 family glycosyltransferase